nr:tripartite motif-containing protein 3-like [Halyomorpha halys]
MVSMSSTLVETVSINYEDFNESFLTCGTCLCMYDGGEHTPKLLACSHTVCLHCLSRIAGQNPASPTFRCPICRDNITVPRGGVAALPPSFLVNQLLDLMASQRREVVPKCSVHFNQELLFCETCDTVFCSQCTSGSHSSAASASMSSCEHTVIPFSIAIKRMSEILLYKANECISKLTEAEEAVRGEVERLEGAARACLERVEALFSEAHAAVEARRQAVVEQINCVRDAKLKVLRAQLDTIQAEKDKFVFLISCRMSLEGESLSSFTHCGFQEPIDIAVDSTYGHILVADNGPSCVFVFDTEGKFLFEVGKKGSSKGCFNLISGVTVGPEGEIVVADSRIQVFSAKGDFLQEIYPQGKGKGRYGGITVDSKGHILGSRTEKGKNFIQVFSLADGNLLETIDSDSSKLKRPSGLVDIEDKYVIVVDLGNDTLKKYCYW